MRDEGKDCFGKERPSLLIWDDGKDCFGKERPTLLIRRRELDDR